MSTRSLLVIGAGPGVSGSTAREFARDGYDVGLVGLGTGMLEELEVRIRDEGVQAHWVEADITDAGQLTLAVQRLAEQLGGVGVLHFNPSAYREADPLTLTVPDLLLDVSVGVGALLTAVQAAYPFLTEGSRVTATGSAAADSPSPAAASMGVQKAGLRNLVVSIDKHLARRDIRAVSVTVEGLLAPNDPDSPFHPDNVASAVHAAALQPSDGWQSVLSHPARQS